MLSAAAYEREQARLDLYGELAEAEEDVRRGDRGVAVATVRKVLRRSRP